MRHTSADGKPEEPSEVAGIRLFGCITSFLGHLWNAEMVCPDSKPSGTQQLGRSHQGYARARTCSMASLATVGAPWCKKQAATRCGLS